MATRPAPLALRIQSLTGEDPSCCLGDYRDEVARLRAQPKFATTLRRVQALGDPKRLLALAFIKRRGEACACQVQAALDLTHATVSHHMGLLETAGLVTVERRGKWAYYTLTKEAHEYVP
ncbi:MAG: ArsR/SmtB family transcription factor [Thermoplasmatota archaeon]